MLLPAFEVVQQRWRAMNIPFTEVFGWIDDEIRERTRRDGLWLDTTHLDPEQTVAVILERLDDTTVRV
jgi:hypothetical protein